MWKSRCYPGLLTKFIRTVALLGSDFVVIRDVVECDGEAGAWTLKVPAMGMRIKPEGDSVGVSRG
ncbi:MAG: hypothetical protein HQ592_00645 [Planctomycetes bacterium]|nr:hypothetical protein [Planctomycetota bacterium]